MSILIHILGIISAVYLSDTPEQWLKYTLVGAVYFISGALIGEGK